MAAESLTTQNEWQANKMAQRKHTGERGIHATPKHLRYGSKGSPKEKGDIQIVASIIIRTPGIVSLLRHRSLFGYANTVPTYYGLNLVGNSPRLLVAIAGADFEQIDPQSASS